MEEFFNKKENQIAALCGLLFLIVIIVICCGIGANQTKDNNIANNIVENDVSENTIIEENYEETDAILAEFPELKALADEYISTINERSNRILNEEKINYIFERAYGENVITYSYVYYDSKIEIGFKRDNKEVKKVYTNRKQDSESVTDLDYYAIKLAIAEIDIIDLDEENFVTENDYEQYKRTLTSVGRVDPFDTQFYKDGKIGTVILIPGLDDFWWVFDTVK